MEWNSTGNPFTRWHLVCDGRTLPIQTITPSIPLSRFLLHSHAPPSKNPPSSLNTSFQVWRLLTSAVFLAGFSPRFVFNMLWLFIYSPVMERTMTEFSSGEFAFCVSFCVLVLDLIGLLNPWYPMYFIAEKLVFAILYLWSREFPNQEVSIYGLVRIVISLICDLVLDQNQRVSSSMGHDGNGCGLWRRSLFDCWGSYGNWSWSFVLFLKDNLSSSDWSTYTQVSFVVDQIHG